MRKKQIQRWKQWQKIWKEIVERDYEKKMWVTNISKGETKALVIGKCNQRDEERKHFSAEETSV